MERPSAAAVRPRGSRRTTSHPNVGQPADRVCTCASAHIRMGYAVRSPAGASSGRAARRTGRRSRRSGPGAASRCGTTSAAARAVPGEHVVAGAQQVAVDAAAEISGVYCGMLCSPGSLRLRFAAALPAPCGRPWSTAGRHVLVLRRGPVPVALTRLAARAGGSAGCTNGGGRSCGRGCPPAPARPPSTPACAGVRTPLTSRLRHQFAGRVASRAVSPWDAAVGRSPLPGRAHRATLSVLVSRGRSVHAPTWTSRAQRALVADPEQTNRVSTTVATSAPRGGEEAEARPIQRSTVSERRNMTTPTPHATYLPATGNVALGGPSHTASTRYTSSSVRIRTRSGLEQAGDPLADVLTGVGGHRQSDDRERRRRHRRAGASRPRCRPCRRPARAVAPRQRAAPTHNAVQDPFADPTCAQALLALSEVIRAVAIISNSQIRRASGTMSVVLIE